MNGVIESFNKIFPNNIARLILDDIKLDLSNYTNNLVRHINKINCIYFSQTGEVWILHTIPEFNDDYGPFLFPLVYQHCADIQMIIVDLDILEHYSELVKKKLQTL